MDAPWNESEKEELRVDRSHHKDKSRFRPCGPCTACCYGAEVKEAIRTGDALMVWNKPRRSRCGYQSDDSHRLRLFPRLGHGCSIHDTRPQACADFDCAWRRGELTEPMRPDRCGVIFWWEHSEVHGHVLVAEEAYPGASATLEFTAICERVSNYRVVFVYRRGPSRTILYKGHRKAVADLTYDPRFQGAAHVPFETILEFRTEYLGSPKPEENPPK